MSEIKTNFEFPRGDDGTKFLQRLVQDLSKNFKYIANNQQQAQSNSFFNGGYADTSGSFSVSATGATTATSTYSFAHNLGVVPSGFVVIDLVISSMPSGSIGPIVSRISSDTTNITFGFSILTDFSKGNQTISGTYKIRVMG